MGSPVLRTTCYHQLPPYPPLTRAVLRAVTALVPLCLPLVITYRLFVVLLPAAWTGTCVPLFCAHVAGCFPLCAAATLRF